MSFLLDVGLPLIAGGGGGWLLVRILGDRLLSHRLSKDLERYKIELTEQTDVLKTRLAIFAHEQNVSLSRVDAQRADAIHTVYGCIQNVIAPLSKIIGGCPIVDGNPERSVNYYRDQAESAHEECGVLTETLTRLAIYFDNDTYKLIGACSMQVMRSNAEFLRDLRRLEAAGTSAIEQLKIVEANRDGLKTVYQESMQPMVSDLTAIFRRLLGIEKG